MSPGILRKTFYMVTLGCLILVSSVSNLPTANRTCQSDHFMCKNQRCIPKNWRCDREYDCEQNGDGDRSDEIDCPPMSCSSKEYLCPEGQCIPRSWVCDSYPDCKSGGDEDNCDIISCSPTEFKCDNGLCIRATWVCDGSNDCADGSDEKEKQCSQSICNSTEFRCEIGECIPSKWLCDGSKDCKSGIDEENCEGPIRCTKEEFRCVDSGSCISQRNVCNGVKDCNDGSDESTSYCVNRVITCPPNQFKCKSSYCISASWRCDGAQDCDDGSDEQNCPSNTTKATLSVTTTMTTSSPTTAQATEIIQLTTPKTSTTKRRPVIASLRTLQKESSTIVTTTTNSVLAVENITPILSASDAGLGLVKARTATATSTTIHQLTMNNTLIPTSKSKSELTARRTMSIHPTTRASKASRAFTTEALLTTLSTTPRPIRRSTRAKVTTSTVKSTLVPTRMLTTKTIASKKRSTIQNTFTTEALLTSQSTTVRPIRMSTKAEVPTSLVSLLTTVKSTQTPTKLTTHPATTIKRFLATSSTQRVVVPITPITPLPTLKTQTPPLCGGLLTSNSGIIKSPNHPEPYPNNAHCKWVIHLPKVFHVITFRIEELFLELDQNCAYDYLMFSDELHNQVGCRHCGSLMYPKVVDVKGHTAIVVFHSDHYNGKRGFRIRYSAFWNY